MSLATRSSLAAFLAMLPAVISADDLASVRDREQIALGKLRKETRDALDEAARLQRSDSERAREVLRDAIAQVRTSTAGTEGERADLVASLQSAMRESSRNSPGNFKEHSAPLSGNRTSPIPKPTPADSDLFRSAATRVKATADQWAAQEKLRKERELATTAQTASVHQSAGGKIPETIDFPKWFAKLSERGKIKLSPQEATVLKALDTPISVDFRSEGLQNALRSVGDKSGVSLDFGKDMLEAVGLRYDDPVTMKLDRAPMRTVLRKVLRDRGMTYVVKEGSILILTPEQASRMMTVQTYDIADFVVDPIRDPFKAKESRERKAAALIRLICTTIDPPSWDFFGGPCTISYNDASLGFVVRASAEIHYSFNRGMVRK